MFAFLTLFGCNSKSNNESCRIKLQSALKVPVSGDIRIANYNNGWSTTSDYNESFDIYFSKNEFYKIIHEAKLQKCSGDTTIYCYEKDSDNNKGAKQIISITFYPDSLLANYSYIEE